jgi:hypothetical protein
MAARLERRTEEGDGRAFAVGAGDVEDWRQAILRPAEAIEDNRDALETETVAGRRELRQPIQLRLDAGVARACEVGHQAASLASGAR